MGQCSGGQWEIFLCTIEKKNKQTNKQTDKKQITEIECSKLFISPIISKSHSFIFVMKDLGL